MEAGREMVQREQAVMAALGAGLRVTELRECVATAELVKLTPKAEKYLGWPLLLAMKLSRS